MTNDQKTRDIPSTDDRSPRAYRKPSLVTYGDLAKLTQSSPPGSPNPDGLVIGSTVYRTS